MESIAQQEAEDLARSLPFDQSQLWGGAVFMVAALLFGLWVLNRNDGNPKQLPTLLEVEARQDLTRKRINPWLALGEFYAVVLVGNWLSQWGIWLGLLVYLLGSALIGWQAWMVYHEG